MTPELLLSLEPEELAVHVLLDVQRLPSVRQHLGMVHGANEARHILERLTGEQPGRHSRGDDMQLAFSEAWAWLEAQGLLVPASGSNGQAGGVF